MRTVEISVTDDHIARGQRCNSTRCPVALAIGEAIGLERGDVDVDDDRIHFWLPGGRFASVAVPEAGAAFIDRFDDRNSVEPFTFTLDLPDAVGVAA